MELLIAELQNYLDYYRRDIEQLDKDIEREEGYINRSLKTIGVHNEAKSRLLTLLAEAEEAIEILRRNS